MEHQPYVTAASQQPDVACPSACNESQEFPPMTADKPQPRGMAQGSQRVMGPSTKVAARRYSELVDAELANLAGYLTERELRTILSTTPSPTWNWQVGMTLAGAVADTYGIDSLDDDAPMSGLVRKLAKLTLTQNLALVDICEGFWKYSALQPQSLQEFAADCGLTLA